MNAEEEVKTINLKELTLEQLKALAYDLILQMQDAQNKLALVQGEIAKRG